jgi:hypothetical protein
MIGVVGEMAEILVKAVDATHADPIKDQRGCYKRGMPVVVMPDGHAWGTEERLPKFVVLKIPLISVSQVQKFVQRWETHLVEGQPEIIQRRVWSIRWADLPAATQNTLSTTGQLTIKATPAYTGSFDFTWAQVKAFFRNGQTGLDETVDL